MDSSLPPQAPYLNTETSGDEVTESEVSGEGAVLKASVTTPTSQQRKSSVKEATGLVLPVNRIKRIAKQETSVKAMAADAAFMIAMAAELFLEKLAYKSATQTLGDRRATVAYNDVATSASQWPCCKFLQGSPEAQHPEDICG